MDLLVTWSPIISRTVEYQYLEYKQTDATDWNKTINLAPSIYFYTIKGLLQNTNYMVRLVNMCVSGEILYGEFKQYPYDSSICCPSTMSLDSTSSYCYNLATASTNNLIVTHYQFTSYSEFGIVFYNKDNFNTNGTWDITKTDYLPNIYYIQSSIAPNTTNSNATYMSNSSVWWNLSRNATDGRLNTTGIWTSEGQSYVGTLGFTRTISASIAGYYLFGMASDNFATVKINNITIISEDDTAASSVYYGTPATDSWTYGYWRVYPIPLVVGDNQIELSVTNTDSQGALGFDIYKYGTTEAQLMACTSLSDIKNYLLFSTASPSHGNVSDGDSFDVGNWVCDNEDAQLVLDGGTYYCRLNKSC